MESFKYLEKGMSLDRLRQCYVTDFLRKLWLSLGCKSYFGDYFFNYSWNIISYVKIKWNLQYIRWFKNYPIFVLNKKFCFNTVSRYLELWLSRTFSPFPSELEISRVNCISLKEILHEKEYQQSRFYQNKAHSYCLFVSLKLFRKFHVHHAFLISWNYMLLILFASSTKRIATRILVTSELNGR